MSNSNPPVEEWPKLFLAADGVTIYRFYSNEMGSFKKKEDGDWTPSPMKAAGFTKEQQIGITIARFILGEKGPEW